MPETNNHSKGNYKQQLMNRKEIPAEAKEKFDRWLWDQETVRVFVDGAELKSQGIFGLGVIFVGQGSTIVKTKKHYNTAMKKVNVNAEIAAVDFALTLIDQVIDEHFYQPSKIIIYSDWNEVEKLNGDLGMRSRIPAVNTVAEKINERKQQFLKAHSEVELDISYLGDERKFNGFYIGAHNSARRAIGI